MIWTILATVGAKLLGFAQKRSDAAVEKYKVDGGVAVSGIQANAAIIQTGMATKWFWIPWSIAAVPTAAWYGWGIADSMLNGSLPDVAALPPQLKEYADAVWQTMFYSGGAVAVGQAATKTIGTVAMNWIARR